MYQKIILVGRLGRDPEMRYTADGSPVTNFSMATDRKWTGRDGEKREETTWWRISVWGKQAETVNEYLSKGRAVLVEGRIAADPQTGGPRIWTGQDGQPRASFEVRALSVRFIGGRGDTAATPGAPAGDVPAEGEISGDEVPF